MANINYTTEEPIIEKYCLCCGKELEEDEQVAGFCADCQEKFEEE